MKIIGPKDKKAKETEIIGNFVDTGNRSRVGN